MHQLFVSIATSAAVLMVSASATLAVGLHQHYITTPSGQVVVIAPGICRMDLQGPIDNLHENFHLGAPFVAFATNPILFKAGAFP